MVSGRRPQTVEGLQPVRRHRLLAAFLPIVYRRLPLRAGDYARPGLIPKPSFVSHICLEAGAGPARDNESAAARSPRCQLSVASLLVGSKTCRGEGKVTNPNRTYHFSAIPLPDSGAERLCHMHAASRRPPVRRAPSPSCWRRQRYLNPRRWWRALSKRRQAIGCAPLSPTPAR